MSHTIVPGPTSASPYGFPKTKPGTGASASASITCGANEEAIIHGFSYQTCSGATLTITWYDEDGTAVTLTYAIPDDTLQIVTLPPMRIKASGTGGVAIASGAAGSKVYLFYSKYAAAVVNTTY